MNKTVIFVTKLTVQRDIKNFEEEAKATLLPENEGVCIAFCHSTIDQNTEDKTLKKKKPDVIVYSGMNDAQVKEKITRHKKILNGSMAKTLTLKTLVNVPGMKVEMVESFKSISAYLS